MTRFDATHPLDDQAIDQIVDRALAPAELRAAIDRLDREPDGWKRCTLAFLEAQCWGEIFRAVDDRATSSLASRPVPLASSCAGPDGGRRRWIRGPLARGNCRGLICHGLGRARGPPQLRGATNDDRPVERQSDPAREWFSCRGCSRREVATPPSGSSRRLADRREPINANGERPCPAGGAISSRHNDRRGGRPDPGRAGNQRAVAQKSATAGDRVRSGRLAKAQGYQVDQRRRFITTTLADGRRVTVPIDQVQIRYTGNNPL